MPALIDILFNEAEFTELFDNIKSKDALNFTDLKNYQSKHQRFDLQSYLGVLL